MTDPVAVPSMTTTPPFPDLADRASGTYNLKAFNFGAHMSGPFNGELEAIVAAAYTNAVAANERASTATDKAALTAVDAEQTALDRIQTGQDRTQTGLDRAAAEAAAAVAGGAAAFIDSNPVVKGSVDATKQVRFEVDGLTTATTRVITVPDKDGTLAMTSDIGGLSGTATGTIDLLTGAPIASAATINLDAATGNRVHITGTTAITAVTLTRGPRTVIFDGILTLTHHATNNKLPGGANITTAAGDVAIYEGDGTTVRCVAYTKASGVAVVVVPSGVGDHEVAVHTDNGYGSTNTKIRRFTTVLKNAGTAITYADSATMGASFTINESGLYAVTTQTGGISNEQFGATCNATALTTSIVSVPQSQRLALASVGSFFWASASAVRRLNPGDVIRYHTGGAAGVASDSISISITKVAA